MVGPCTKGAIISKWFIWYGWIYPQIKADSLHLIVIVSFQSARVQKEQNKKCVTVQLIMPFTVSDFDGWMIVGARLGGLSISESAPGIFMHNSLEFTENSAKNKCLVNEVRGEWPDWFKLTGRWP